MSSPVLSVSENKKHTTEYYCLNRAHILFQLKNNIKWKHEITFQGGQNRAHIFFSIEKQYQMKTWNYLSAFTGWGGGGHSRPFCDDVRGDGGLESKMILHGDFLNTGGDWSPEIQWNNIFKLSLEHETNQLSLFGNFLFFLESRVADPLRSLRRWIHSLHNLHLGSGI